MTLTGMSRMRHPVPNPGEVLMRARPIAVVVLLAIADVLTTYIGLAGQSGDANPYVAGLLARHGYVGLLAVKAVTVALTLLVFRLPKPYQRPAWGVVIACFAVGPVWNGLALLRGLL